MAIIISDNLQILFPHWNLDRRATIWLWLTLRARGGGGEVYLGNFDTQVLRDRIAKDISGMGLIAEIDNLQNRTLLPKFAFSWIEKDGRQPAWLLRQFERYYQNKTPYLIDLTPRETLIALFDYWGEEKSKKQNALNHLKALWVQQQLHDKQLSWYASASKEKQKCQIAWQWYQDHHKWVASYATEFSTMEDVFEFLDGTNFKLEEKLHHLEQIKKKFKAQQTQANRRGKTQTNISLSDDTRMQLDELAGKERRTKTEVIELLIQNAHEHGMPN